MKKIFSYQIIKQSFKSVWIWWLIAIVVTSLNLFAFPSMESVTSAQLLSMFAESGLSGNGVIFVTICAILFANVFITSEVDKGTLAITLNTPITRLKVLLSKALVYVVLLTSISLFVAALGTLSPLIYGVGFEFGKWWVINALWLLYSFAIGGIVFAIGCWFNKSRYALGLSAGILGAFFIFNMLAGIESFEFCKYFTLQTLFNMSAIINGESVVWQMIALPIIGIPFYLIGIIKFLKKDLPI